MSIEKNQIDGRKYPNCYKGFQYALDVYQGKILVSKVTFAAVKRFLNDWERMEEIDCPFYFVIEKAEKFLKLVQQFSHVIGKWSTPKIILEPWQCFMFMNIMGFYSYITKERRFRTAHIEVPRGQGKAISLDTLIPTPKGLVRFKDIKVGDTLFDKNGSKCRVIAETPVHVPDTSYKINLDKVNSKGKYKESKTIIASDNHLWFVANKSQRERKSRHSKLSKEKLNNSTRIKNKIYYSVKDTKEISKDLHVYKKKECNYAIPKYRGITDKGIDLCFDAYFLGYWLGGGTRGSGYVSVSSIYLDDFLSLIDKSKYSYNYVKQDKDSNCYKVYVKGLVQDIKKVIDIEEKKIPSDILSYSYETRLSLLQGLLDSDGSICKDKNDGSIEFTSISRDMAVNVVMVISSLGYKANYQKEKIKSNFKTKNEFYYRVCFTPKGSVDLFRLSLKKQRQIRNSTCTQQDYYYYISNVEKIEDTPMKCITVDSEDGSFLITEYLIPTHNSANASQVALYFLALDNPIGNHISCCATRKEQARIVLDSARAMAKASKSFLKHTGTEVQAHKIVHERSNSHIKALSADSTGLDGLADILAICDELHAMNRKTFETIESGMSKRKDSLLLCITTAGYGVDGVGKSQSDYAKKVALGDVEDDTFFSLIYTIDENDDIFDENTWKKANPNWGVSVDPINFAAKAKKAKSNPSDIDSFKIKHLNCWVSQANQFFSLKDWDECLDPSLTPEKLKGEKCFVGIDLASKIDLTCFVKIFKKDGIYYLLEDAYIPEKTVQETNNALYPRCVHDGYLIETKGEAINYPKLGEDFLKLSKLYRVLAGLYDPWNATEFAQRVSNKIEMLEMKMNVGNLSEAMKKLDALIREKRIRHRGNPLFRWCIGNVVAKIDHNENVYPRKSNEKLKIDLAVATIMALAGWINEEEKESVYNTKELFII